MNSVFYILLLLVILTSCTGEKSDNEIIALETIPAVIALDNLNVKGVFALAEQNPLPDNNGVIANVQLSLPEFEKGVCYRPFSSQKVAGNRVAPVWFTDLSDLSFYKRKAPHMDKHMNMGTFLSVGKIVDTVEVFAWECLCYVQQGYSDRGSVAIALLIILEDELVLSYNRIKMKVIMQHFLSVLFIAFHISCFAVDRSSDMPNFIIILTDDQGYNDLSCFGSPDIKTPCIDKMASEGLKCTSFYAQPVCGPSRAALLSGSYPIRIGEPKNRKSLHTQLHPKEFTIAEMLKTKGYKTACFGKWHAGLDKGQWPTEQGFDYFYGTPMFNGYTKLIDDASFRCSVIRNRDTVTTIYTMSEMGNLTKMYTKEAINFIKENKKVPFFIYLAHNMPHVPLGASKKFLGTSDGGFYGDVIEELDWGVGEVLKTLKKQGLDENTMVIFTSDNGPWIEDKIGDHAGCALPFKGNKMQTWEGGIRVPAIIQWKGKIKEGSVTDELMTTMDFFPTFSDLSGADVPQDLTLDGRSFTDIILNDGSSLHECFYYYAYTHLQAVRADEWKLVLPRVAKPAYMGWWARKIEAVDEVCLYNLDTDKEEAINLAAQYPEKVEELMALIEKGRVELGDNNTIGTGARFHEEGTKNKRIVKYEKWSMQHKSE